MWRKDSKLYVSQWQLLAWKGLFWQQNNPGKNQSYRKEYEEGGMTKHHKALQRYVFGMVAFLPVGTLPMHTCNLRCHDFPHAFSCPLLLSGLIYLLNGDWLFIYQICPLVLTSLPLLWTQWCRPVTQTKQYLQSTSVKCIQYRLSPD